MPNRRRSRRPEVILRVVTARPLASHPFGVRMPHGAKESRRHKIPKTRPAIDDWAGYDTALQRWGN